MEPSHSRATTEPATRAQWQALLSRFEPPDTAEYRRGHTRLDAVLGIAELTFEKERRRVLRTAKLLNVSTGGVLVRGQQRIDVGTRVQVRVLLDDAEVAVAGEVRHCTETVGAFKIGIELHFAHESA